MMFQPSHFQEQRVEVIHKLMRSFPFATLITAQTHKISADHIPLLIHEKLSERGTIRGHMAKANPICCSPHIDCEALAIFQGPHAYITPSYYPSKKKDGKVVPTWNYAVVHARGKIQFVEEEAWLRNHLIELTARNESSREHPWRLSDAPEDFIFRQIKGIVGIELIIDSIDGKWKMSQNKDEADRDGVRRGLEAEQRDDTAAVARLVARREG